MKPRKQPKSTAQRVREAEAMHKARGERQVKVWVPKGASQQELQALRDHAAALCAKYLPKPASSRQKGFAGAAGPAQRAASPE